MGDNPFDIIGNMKDVLGPMAKGSKVGLRIGREIAGRRLAAQVEAELGPEVAEAVLQAARAGHDPSQIIREARRARERQRERDEVLAAPPPVFGSARFATARELAPYLAGSDAFDRPSSLLLGAYEDPQSPDPVQFVHWDGEGHLLTVARTRTGKSLTTIIPNLLRYQGSAVVLDPKGELYAATSKWREKKVGPVYRLAPLDDGTDPATAGYARHGFNPLAHIRTEEQARALADQFFPYDPRASEFFRDDATAFMTAVILYVTEKAPPEQRHLATVRAIATEPSPALKVIVEAMRTSSSAIVREAANNVLGKSHACPATQVATCRPAAPAPGLSPPAAPMSATPRGSRCNWPSARCCSRTRSSRCWQTGKVTAGACRSWTSAAPGPSPHRCRSTPRVTNAMSAWGQPQGIGRRADLLGGGADLQKAVPRP